MTGASEIMNLIRLGVVIVFVVGILVYTIMLLLYVFLPEKWRNYQFIRVIRDGPAQYMFGLPISAATAFAIVCVFQTFAVETPTGGHARTLLDKKTAEPNAEPNNGSKANSHGAIDPKSESASQNTSAGLLSFSAFSMSFTGPAAPATLWIVCYLTLIGSMRIVRWDNSASQNSSLIHLEIQAHRASDLTAIENLA